MPKRSYVNDGSLFHAAKGALSLLDEETKGRRFRALLWRYAGNAT